jgi:hypothetical protein
MTPESPGRYPPRGRSESSGTRAPEDLEPSTAQLLLTELRAMRAANAQLEGRVSAEIVAAEKRLRSVADGSTRRDVEATAFDLGRELGRWKKSSVLSWFIAAMCSAILGTRTVLGSDIANKSEEIAEATVDAKAEELHREIDETAKTSAANGRRIEVLEAKIDKVLVALEDLAEPASVVPVPKKRGVK